MKITVTRKKEVKVNGKVLGRLIGKRFTKRGSYNGNNFGFQFEIGGTIVRLNFSYYRDMTSWIKENPEQFLSTISR